MRYLPSFFNNTASRRFMGENKAHGRVTVEPYWHLRETTPVYGKAFRGPYRWYIDPDRVEMEIPSIKSISWNRSNSQDLASCTIVLYNTWHNRNLEAPELAGQFGMPGYFWPHRGKGDSGVGGTWEQQPGKGAYDYDGNWDSTFSWRDVLVEDALIRTYEGYGAAPKDGNYTSIADNVENENLLQTGVWIIDSVIAGSDGFMTLNCTDIGRILLDQTVFPPVIPSAVYPLEYYPPGKSAFDSPWGPPAAKQLSNGRQTISIEPGSKGEVWFGDAGASSDTLSNVNSQYGSANSLDGSWSTIALTEAYDTTNEGSPWFEFEPGAASGSAVINSMQVKFWAGGYTAYVSVKQGGSWQGSGSVPGSSIPYIKKVEVPLALPDGMEPPFNIEFGNLEEDDEGFEYTRIVDYNAQTVRLTLTNLYYSGIPDGTKQYRGGIRDVVFYRDSVGKAIEAGPPDFSEVAWTFAMESHPTKGYWITDAQGYVYGFGDAADYDSTGFGPISLAAGTPMPPFFDDPGGENTNRIVGIASHPDGKGYWLVDWMGRVYAQGSATHYGNVIPGDPFRPFWEAGVTQARGIAATHTGNGYWVLYSNGVVHGFGDASIGGTSNFTVPNSPVGDYMQAYLWNKTKDTPWPTYYYTLQKGTAIASHPTKMGFWVTDGSGQVWAYGASQHHGQLYNREYATGMAGNFRLDDMEWATCIESTTDGNGYWIGFGSGKVAAFGSATAMGKTPYVFETAGGIYPENVIKPDDTVINPEGFRRIMWSLARDPDGEGFWVLNAAGGVQSYKADFWGQPGYGGLTGLRWHDGNFNGDWTEIVKEILLWGGFLAYDPGITGTEAPAVYGQLESTGIYTDTNVPADKFDKATLIDVIKELAEVVGYYFKINEEGAAIFSSPNWWRAGNFDENGVQIYVNELGERVEELDVGAQPFIPVVHEDSNMLTYSATLSGADKVTKVIVGTDLPDAKDPSRTGYATFVPPHSLTTVSGGINTMRGINRTAIWISQLFENERERRLMAELIGIHSYFGGRAGQASIVANPALSIGDQIRLVERNTSETYIHLINSINSSLDNDTGVYTMDISTFWLGSADNWVITADPLLADEYAYVVISEELNSWQLRTNRGLESGTSPGASVVNANGGFVQATAGTQSNWDFNGSFVCSGSVELFRIEATAFSNLGTSAFLEIKKNGVTVDARYISFQNEVIYLGDYTSIGNVSQYTYTVTGAAGNTGEGRLTLTFKSANTQPVTVSDSILFTLDSDIVDPLPVPEEEE